MRKVTGYNLVSAINQLPKNRDYNYLDAKNHGLIRIVDVKLPAGPIVIRRWRPDKGETFSSAKNVSISANMIWRIANAFFEGKPINFDRVLGGSYNTRSVLESLISYTPQFYQCTPGRILDVAGRITKERGHKHVVWLPDKPHKNGELAIEKMESCEISEIPTADVVYDSLDFPEALVLPGMDIEVKRRHLQIQIALYLIGKQLGYDTWIAQNDKGIKYRGKALVEYDGVLSSIEEKPLVGAFPGAAAAGRFIDCIWFDGEKDIPAVMEVEHTTGVKSGLDRMKNFRDSIPKVTPRYVIVAPDEARELVFSEASKPMYKDMEIRYFPYSAVEELYVLCEHRHLRGVAKEFLDCYMEQVSAVSST